MNRQLLDVNVFFALAWPRHESHASAQAWFAKSGCKAWATSPLTHLGVLRLLTNAAVTQGTVSASTALDVIDQATRNEGHEFWPLERTMTAGLKMLTKRATGYKQWTDAILLWQAIDRDGVLVTFDSGIKSFASADHRERVLLLRSG